MPLLIPLSRQPVMPWKNGGGTTREIMRFPADATLESMDWRVSVATVSQGGPFSFFPGMDRTLAILEGAGITLDVAGDRRRLSPADAAVRFPGEAATRAELLDGAILDFNVMTRRCAFDHAVEKIASAGPRPAAVSGDTLILVLAGGFRLPDGTPVGKGDAVFFAASEAACSPDFGDAEIMLVRLCRRAGA